MNSSKVSSDSGGTGGNDWVTGMMCSVNYCGSSDAYESAASSESVATVVSGSGVG